MINWELFSVNNNWLLLPPTKSDTTHFKTITTKKNFHKAQSINIPNNCHRFWIILVLIHSHHKHGSISWGGWNDDLFGPALQVSAGLFCRCENTSWLNNIFSTAFTPWNCAWVFQCIDKDWFAIYDKLAIFCLNSSLESSMSGVVLKTCTPFWQNSRN